MTEPVRQTAERALRRFAPPLYRWLQRRSGQRLAKRFGTAEERFRHIYKSNHWSEAESVSGPGSTLEETEPNPPRVAVTAQGAGRDLAA